MAITIAGCATSMWSLPAASADHPVWGAMVAGCGIGYGFLFAEWWPVFLREWRRRDD